MNDVTVIDHPLVQHKLTIMRKKETSTAGFRRLLREISTLLCYEVTRDLELTREVIDTPLATIEAPVLEGKKLVFASILRAGNGLLEGMLDLVPSARVSHIGVYRDHETLQAVEYYFEAPEDVSERLIIVVDPMLATGNSSIASIDKLKERGAISVFSACRCMKAYRQFPQQRIRMCRSSQLRSTSHLNEKGGYISTRSQVTLVIACTAQK